MNYRKGDRHAVVTHVLGTFHYPCVRAGQNIVVAERVGFEPTVRFPAHTLSKRAP